MTFDCVNGNRDKDVIDDDDDDDNHAKDVGTYS
jgi:hypothetical protein